MGMFEPEWKNEDIDQAIAAVKKLTDQDEIASAARDAPEHKVREAAVEMLTDQNVLLHIARYDCNADVRYAALEGVTDQTILADIAKDGNARDQTVCLRAVAQITDWAVIADIAENARNGEVIVAALKMMFGQSLSEEELMEKVSDRSILERVAKAGHSLDTSIRSAAEKRIDIVNSYI